MRLSNRLLAIFILVVVLGGGGGFFHWLFFQNVGTLEITVNAEATVGLERDSATLYERVCDPKNPCVFSQIPALDYTVSIRANRFVSRRIPVSLLRWETMSEHVKLSRRVEAETVEISWETLIENPENADITPVRLLSTGGFSITQNPFTISTLSRETLYSLPASREIESIRAHPDGFVSWRENDRYFFYDAEYDRVHAIAWWDTSIRSIKRTPLKNRHIIAADRLSFFYDTGTLRLSEHPVFSDWVFISRDRVVGLVRTDDPVRTARVGAPALWGDTLFLADVSGTDARAIYEDRGIDRIEFVRWEVFVVGADGDILHLKNIE